jgi:flavin-dependent dehydrogenase
MQFDVLVIGGGPAGASAAIRAAKGGLNVAVIERAAFPRDVPGEALHPQAEAIFRKLGVAKEIAARDFIRAPGWILQHRGRHPVLFADRGKLRFGYQAWRADLDMILLNRARGLGATILQPLRVIGANLAERFAQTDQGKIQFRYLVDATGANGLLFRELRLRASRITPPLIARYGYVTATSPKGVMPEFHEHACGWTWLARVRSDCCQFVRLALDRSGPLPALSPPYDSVARPRGADVTWRFVPACAGEAYFLCGDAAAVLDPAASSGVGRALASGMRAAQSILEATHGGDPASVAAAYRKWSLRQFTHYARLLAARYAGFERPPAWLGALEAHFAALEKAIRQDCVEIPAAAMYYRPKMTDDNATPAPAKKKAATKKAPAAAMGKNLAALTSARIIPKNYKFLTPAEKKALETLSASEVKAIVSTRTKLGKKYFAKHAAHGMYY